MNQRLRTRLLLHLERLTRKRLILLSTAAEI
jgi:hypothetical protein